MGQAIFKFADTLNLIVHLAAAFLFLVLVTYGSFVVGLIGKVDFTVRHLSSTVTTFPNSWTDFSSGQQCLGGSREV